MKVALGIVQTLACAWVSLAVAQQPHVVLDPATAAWLDAARTERADILALGDSVVLFGGHGWDDGLNRAGGERFGLAGTGLLSETSSGDGFRLLEQFNWQLGVSHVPESVRQYSVANRAFTTGTNSQRRLSISIDPSSLLAGQALRYHAWGVSASGNDSVSIAARLGVSPFTVLRRSPQMILDFPTDGLRELTFDFPDNLTANPTIIDYYLDQSDDASIFYIRATRPGASGITVTSIGLGGQSVRTFYNQIWNGGSWNQQGRAAFLNAIVQGGSGKLLVPIFEGFNDRNETNPSLITGIPVGNSPEAFVENMQALMDLIRSDWAFAGRDQSDLSFVVFRMYDIQGGPDQKLQAFGDALRAFAIANEGVSFVDLHAIGVPYAEAVTKGYMADGIHLNRQGARFYSRELLDALISAQCPGNVADDFGFLTPDQAVDFGDFVALLGLINPCPSGQPGCRGDIADDFGFLAAEGAGPDGVVDFGDFVALLGLIGPCP